MFPLTKDAYEAHYKALAAALTPLGIKTDEGFALVETPEGELKVDLTAIRPNMALAQIIRAAHQQGVATGDRALRERMQKTLMQA
jgi:hypothetical protein